MRLLSIIMMVALTACGQSKVMAPIGQYEDSPRRVISTPAPAPSAAPNRYTVKSGDTLYSISFRYGMDYRDVARLNGIRSPFTIYVGQQLKFSGTPTRTAAAPARTPQQQTQPSRPAVQPSRPATQTQPSTQQQAAPPPQAQPATPPSQVRQAAAPLPMGTQDFAWRWPTKGPVLSTYSESSPGRKGINIGGTAGQNVIAAAPGRVVYSGDGLPRYGNLLIIKHNDVYLSAYAHNASLLVKEGDAVEAGQRIATLGRTGSSQRDQLHFEIRRNGKPVDPMRFLPKQ